MEQREAFADVQEQQQDLLYISARGYQKLSAVFLGIIKDFLLLRKSLRLCLLVSHFKTARDTVCSFRRAL